MTVRAVFFDVDDTLYSTSHFAERARRRAVEAMVALGLKVDPDTAYRELLEVIQEFGPNAPHHFDTLLQRLPAGTRPRRHPALLVAAGVVAYHETKRRELRPFPGVRRLFQQLAATDLVLGVITDGRRIKQAEKLVRLGLAPYLTEGALFISEDVGISKPNPKLYQRALEACGLRPSEAVYVGDNPLLDIDPPNRLGMLTVRHRWPGKHAAAEGETRPDFEVRTFRRLEQVLRRLGLPL